MLVVFFFSLFSSLLSDDSTHLVTISRLSSVVGLSSGYTVTEAGPFGLYFGMVGPVSYQYGRSSPPLPSMGTGAINSILAHPTDPNTIWVASVNGGIWKTTDGGANWSSLTDFKGLSLSVTSISFDPTDSTLKSIIASVGSSSNLKTAGNFIGYYYTTNGGVSWTINPLAADFQANGVSVSKAFKIGSKIVLCGAPGTPIWVSSNLGSSGSAFGTAGLGCFDMLYIHSTSTFIAALTRKLFCFLLVLDVALLRRSTQLLLTPHFFLLL